MLEIVCKAFGIEVWELLRDASENDRSGEINKQKH